MITLSELEKFDTERMFEVYDKWPEIALESYQNCKKTISYEKVSHIVFAGMGGSGAMSDIFAAILSKTDTHVSIVKGYHIPKTVNVDSIIILTSVSGNTSETVSVLKNAIRIGAKIIAFSDGGEIKKICEQNNITHINTRKYHSPRASFTAFLYTMLGTLKPILPINELDILESIKNLEKIREQIYSKNLTKTNQALEISEWIEKTPVIYYPWGLQSAAIRFKNSLQENCKLHVIAEDVIEACHNGIVAWEKSKEFIPILSRGTEDFEKTVKLWEILKKFFKKEDIKFKEITSVKGNILTKLICLIYLLDFSSIYLSVKLGIDPSPVKSIEFIKKEINQI